MKKLVIETLSLISNIKVSEISLETTFEDLGLDSIDMIQLIINLENELEITFDDTILETKTVNELIEIIKQIIK